MNIGRIGDVLQGEQTRPRSPDSGRALLGGRSRPGGGPVPRADGSGVSSTVTTGYPQSPQPQRFVRGAGTGGGRGADDYFVSRLYEEHAGFLLVFVQRLTGGDLHWAEDVIQETLLRAWRHADELLSGGHSS